MKYADIASTVAAVGAILALAILLVQQFQQPQQTVAASILRPNSWRPNVHSNVRTDFNPQISTPQISESALIHPYAILIDDCHIGKMVMVAPTAVCRGDEGTPIRIGDYSNMQDGVVVDALETTVNGTNIDGRRFSQEGERLAGAKDDSAFFKRICGMGWRSYKLGPWCYDSRSCCDWK